MDIDIDFADRQKILDKLPHVKATINDHNGLKSHNTGVYFTDAPTIPDTNQCSLDYQVADELGYFKLDLLNVNIYSQVTSRKHLQELFDKEPPWHKLQNKDFVDQLLQPTNLEQLASCLAIIRPAKRYLLNMGWEEILKQVWVKPTDDQYFFKKAHSFSYAGAVTVHMNLIDSTN